MWLYHRFNLNHRDLEDLLAEKGVVVTHESIHLWCIKFGSAYARKLRCQHQGYEDTFFLDEVFVKIQGKQQYLWRAIDQEGDVVDVLLQTHRNGKAANSQFSSKVRQQSALSYRRCFEFKFGYTLHTHLRHRFGLKT